MLGFQTNATVYFFQALFVTTRSNLHSRYNYNRFLVKTFSIGNHHTVSSSILDTVFPRKSARTRIKNFGQKGGRLLEGLRALNRGGCLFKYFL